MPELGNLWYSLGIDDKTSGQLDKIITEIENKLNGGNKAIKINNLEISSQAASSFLASLEKQVANNAVLNIATKVGAFILEPSAVEGLVTQVSNALSSARISFKGLDMVDMKSAITLAVRDSFENSKADIADKIRKAISAGGQNIPITVNGSKIAQSIADALAKKTVKIGKVNIDAKAVGDEIEKTLSSRKFKIDVVIDKASVETAVQEALTKAGLNKVGDFSKSDARLAKANNDALAAADKHAIAQARLAAMHDKASRAAEKHSRYEKAISDQMRTSTQVATILGNAIGNVFSVYAVKSFLTEVVKVGGELEKQRLAMGAIMGDTYQAGEIYKQVANLSMISPFDVEDLVKYSKQLNAFGIKYSDLYDTTKRLSDIAAAVGVDFGRIAYEFGQTSARGWLDGRELRMFANSGIPLLQKLSEYYTKARQEIITAAEVREMITKREVSFQDVKAVLWEMTNAGGEFYQMQEVMAESLAAKWRNLGNAWNLMMGDVAESGMGKGLKKLAEVLTTLTENWGTVATVIGLVAAKMGAATLAQRTYNTALSAGTKEALAFAEAESMRAGMMSAQKQGVMAAFAEGIYTGYTRISKTAFSAAVAEQKLTTAQVQQLVMSRNMPSFWDGMNKRKKMAYLLTLGLSKAEIKAAMSSSVFAASLGKVVGQMAAMTKALLVNPTTYLFAGVSGAILLYERYNKQLKESEERTEKIAEKAKEGFRNLEELMNSEALKTRPTNEAGYKAAIDSMKDAIKDYAPDWRDIFAEAFGDGTKEGIKEVADQYDFLKGKLGELKESYEELDRVKKIFEAANKETGGWLEIFDETALTNLKEADDEMAKVNAKILKAAKEIPTKEFVEQLGQMNEEYGKWLKENQSKSNFDKLSKAVKDFSQEIQRLRHKGSIIDFPELVEALNAMSKFNTAFSTAKDDAQDLAKQVKSIVDALKGEGFDPSKPAFKRAMRMEVDVVLDYKGIQDKDIRKSVHDYLIKEGLEEPLNYVEDPTASTGGDNKEDPDETKNKTDEILKAWQERFKKLKEAYQEYKRWFELYKDEQKALNKTKENPLFADLNVNPAEIKKNLEVLRDEIKTTTKARRDFQLQVGGEVVNIDYNELKDTAKKIADAMQEELTEEAKRWDLARKFNEAGVGMDEAVKIAFEADLQVWDRQAREMADRLSEEMFKKGYVLNPNEEFGVSFKMNNVDAEKFFGADGELYKLWKAVKDHIEKNGIDLYSKSAGSIQTFANIEQRIKTLRDNMERELAAANSADPIVLEGIRRNFEQQISKLKQEFFEGSDVYKQLTQDTTNFGVAKLAELRKLAKNIKEAMDAGTTSKDDKGNIVRAFTYGDKDYEVTEKTYDGIVKLIAKLEKKAKSATDSFKEMWKWINGEGDLKFADVAKDIQDVFSSLSETADQLSQLFGDSKAGKVAGAVSGIFGGMESITKAFDEFKSGDYMGGVNDTLRGINTAVEAIQNAMPNDDKLIIAMENMESSFELSISNLADVMKTQNVDDAYKTYQEQVTNSMQMIENYLERVYDISKTSGTILWGDSANYHSSAYNIDKHLSDDYWEILKREFGVSNAGELFKMDVSSWYRLLTHFPQIWAAIKDAMAQERSNDNPNDSEIIEKIEAAAAKWKELEDLEAEWAAYTINITFENVRSAFESLMKDMSASWSDYADSFEEQMYNAIVNSETLNRLGTEKADENGNYGLLATYYKKLAEYATGGYTAEEIAELRRMWEEMANISEDIKADAKELSGWNGGSSSSSLSSAIQGVSAEQVDLLAAYTNGIRGDTAVQRLLMEQFMYEMMPTLSFNSSAQLAQLNLVAQNTREMADSNALILGYVTSLDERLRSVIEGTAKVYVK